MNIPSSLYHLFSHISHLDDAFDRVRKESLEHIELLLEDGETVTFCEEGNDNVWNHSTNNRVYVRYYDHCAGRAYEEVVYAVQKDRVITENTHQIMLADLDASEMLCLYRCLVMYCDWKKQSGNI